MLRFTPAEGRYALHYYPCVLLPDNVEIQLVLTVLSIHNLRLELLSYGPARECWPPLSYEPGRSSSAGLGCWLSSGRGQINCPHSVGIRGGGGTFMKIRFLRPAVQVRNRTECVFTVPVPPMSPRISWGQLLACRTLATLDWGQSGKRWVLIGPPFGP